MGSHERLIDVILRHHPFADEDFPQFPLCGRLLFPLFHGPDFLQKGRQIDLKGGGRLAFQFILQPQDQRLQRIRAVQNDIDQRGGDLQFVVSRLVQEVFQIVGEISDFFQVEKSGHPFDRVKGSEDCVDAVRVFRVLLQVEDIDLDFIDIFQPLRNKIGGQRGIGNFTLFFRRGGFRCLDGAGGIRLPKGGNAGKRCNGLQKRLNVDAAVAFLPAMPGDFLHQRDAFFKSAETLLFVFQCIEDHLLQKMIQSRGHTRHGGHGEGFGGLDNLLQAVHEFTR